MIKRPKLIRNLSGSNRAEETESFFRVSVSPEGGSSPTASNPGGVRFDWPATATGWKAEYSPTLQPHEWYPMPAEAMGIENGRAVMDRTTDGPRMFYRLRRDPE